MQTESNIKNNLQRLYDNHHIFSITDYFTIPSTQKEVEIVTNAKINNVNQVYNLYQTQILPKFTMPDERKYIDQSMIIQLLNELNGTQTLNLTDNGFKIINYEANFND